MQDSTFRKKIIYIIIYIILFSLAGYFLYKLIAPAPTCFDKRQNQNERGVDCGGQCKPCKSNIETQDLQIKEISFVDGGSGTYDVVAKVANPNYLTGASSFSYEFVLKGANGEEVARSKGESFILPADTKYVAQIGLRPQEGGIVKEAELIIGETSWKELANLGNPQLEVNGKKFQKNATGIGSAVNGVVKNNSPYDLEMLSVVVILRDQYDKVLGVSMTKKDNVRAREERAFVVTWPTNFKAEVGKVEVQAQSNVYDLIES